MALLRLKQVTEKHPGITMGQLRWWIRASRPLTLVIKGEVVHLKANGFAPCWVRPSPRRILVDEERMLEWLRGRSGEAAIDLPEAA